MNTYSTIHQNIVKYFSNNSLFQNPEEVLGPNWKAVLNFWWFIENLDSCKNAKIWQKYYKIEWGSWAQHLYNICSPVYPYLDLSNCINQEITNKDSYLIFHTTIELIIMDELFQNNQSLIYFSLFLQS
jgi:hypothetical protein